MLESSSVRVSGNLTDTHCHLYFDSYDEDRAAVLARAWEAGVERILVPGIDLASSRAAITLAEEFPGVYAAVGVHPNSATTWDAASLDALRLLAAHPKVVAIGEIGLDYYRDRAPRNLQHQVFREQVSLAGRLNLPVVVHTRNQSPEQRACLQDVLQTLVEFRSMLPLERPGVVHSFSGNEAEAQAALEAGFYIGFTGPVTFKNAHALRRVVASVSLDRLLIETDAPFLTPHPYRGKRNQPAYVMYIAEQIGQIFDLSLEKVSSATTANARQLFQWSK